MAEDKGKSRNSICRDKTVTEEVQKVAFYKLFAVADRLDVVLMILGSFGAMANGISQPLLTVVFGKTIHSFGSSSQPNIVKEVSEVALKFLYLAIGSSIAGLLQVSCWMVTGERQSACIRSLYLETILGQDVAFFDTETTTSEVVGRLTSDTILIQEAMGEKVGKFIQLASTFFGGFLIAFIKGWLLTMVLLSCIPLVRICGGTMTMILSKMSSLGQTANEEAGNLVEQTVGVIRTVASFTGEKHAIEKYNAKLKVACIAAVHQGLVTGVGVGTMLLFLFGTYGLAVWYGSKLIMMKSYNGGQVITIILSVMYGGISLGQISPYLNAFAAGQAAAYKMYETIKVKPSIDAYNLFVLDDVHGKIEFRDVHFRYPSRPEIKIFSGFSLQIPGGKTTALVGQSGSGKSTIICLIERFYDPNSGEVLIDGVDLKKLKLSWIREKIGLVSQEPILFGTTIKENIAYGKEIATDLEIRTAIELANATKLLDRMSEGLATMVGEHGTLLSGGEKQRIAIARALLRNPKIIQVIIPGTHEELIQDPAGSYAQLVRLQEGAKEFEDSHTKYADLPGGSLDMHSPISTRSSLRESLLGSHHSLNINTVGFGVPGPINVNEDEEYNQSTNEKEKSKAGLLRRLAYLNKPELAFLFLGGIAAAVHGIIFPMFGLLLSEAIHTFYEPPAKLHEDSKYWALWYLTFGVVALIALPLQHYFFGVAGGKLIERLRSMTFRKVVHQDISWFDDPANSRFVEGIGIHMFQFLATAFTDFSKIDMRKKKLTALTLYIFPFFSSGAICARLSTDASAVWSLVGDALALIVQNIGLVIAAIVIAFVANWRLALIILSVCPLIFIQGSMKAKLMKGFSADTKMMYEEASQVVNDAVGSIRTVASFCAEKKVMNLYEKKCNDPIKQGVRLGLVSGAGFGLSLFVLYSTMALCFYIGSVLVKHGKATFTEVFKVFFALAIAAVCAFESSGMAADNTKAKDSAASIFAILDSKTKIDSSSNKRITLAYVDGDIEFEHVSFRYPMRPNVQILSDLSLRILSGKTVALVGESGCGKSIVISLIERFYYPYSGHIYLDSVEIKNLKLSWLRQQMGLVSQEPILFNETIRTNIVYGKQGVDAAEEEVIAAAKAANAHNFISSLPHGYSTSVGERGVQLSGGQKQRIAIARAIVKNPKILLFDEATSDLDAESERVVQDALDRVMVNRTTVVVAHRLTTVVGADIIAVVKNGAIVEKGRHEELLKITDGAYASSVALQMSTT